MFRFLIISTILFFSFPVKGQVLSDPLSGRPYMIKVYDDIRGSAYLFEEWKPADVTDKHGTTFLNVLVRFDLYANKLFYNYGDITYEFVTDIHEIELFPFRGDTLTKMIFKRGFTLGDKLTPDKFAEVLAEGKVTVIKYIYRSLIETTEYNVPGKIKTFTNHSIYFFTKDDKTISQRPGLKILEELVKDKWPAVESYSKQYSLNPRNGDDCIKLIMYYNSL